MAAGVFAAAVTFVGPFFFGAAALEGGATVTVAGGGTAVVVVAATDVAGAAPGLGSLAGGRAAVLRASALGAMPTASAAVAKIVAAPLTTVTAVTAVRPSRRVSWP